MDTRCNCHGGEGDEPTHLVLIVHSGAMSTENDVNFLQIQRDNEPPIDEIINSK
jgi:hypothetical protein